MGGIIINGGRFDWASQKGRFPLPNTPDVSYHSVNFAEAMGNMACIARACVAPLRNTGVCLSPMNAWQIMLGLETLALRMYRHCNNALAVAKFLESHEQVTWVKYAGLDKHLEHNLAQKYYKGKPSAILTFGAKGEREAGAKFIDALEHITRLVNIGDAKLLACQPANHTSPTQ